MDDEYRLLKSADSARATVEITAHAALPRIKESGIAGKQPIPAITEINDPSVRFLDFSELLFSGGGRTAKNY
jgi:hypothetical protein